MNAYQRSPTRTLPIVGVAFVIGMIAITSCAATGVRSDLRTVVTCVYEIVRSHPGVLTTEVYVVGNKEYVIKFKFRGKAGKILTGDFGVFDDMLADGSYMYTNKSPSGQPDDSGSEELELLSTKLDDMASKCHVMPGLDDTIRLPGMADDPPRQKIDMSSN